MGIHCQINLYKPPDGAYRPGDIVCGVIEYGVDEPTIFSKITVSLKGTGTSSLEDDSDNNRSTYSKEEVYVHIDNVEENEKMVAHDISMYKRTFDFKLPENIPSSVKFRNFISSKTANCCIAYYIRIKFERPGFLKFHKMFKKELTVVSGIKPELPTEPIIYGEVKKLFTLSPKDSTVNIKATINKSVVSPGENIDLQYEVSNNTQKTIKKIVVNLTEVYTIKTNGPDHKVTNFVFGTKSKLDSLESGEDRNFNITIDVPSDKNTLGFSNVVSRDYFVVLKAVLPFPHINAYLAIPVEIGDVIHDDEEVQATINHEDPPPSYWEVMAEDLESSEYNKT